MSLTTILFLAFFGAMIAMHLRGGHGGHGGCGGHAHGRGDTHDHGAEDRPRDGAAV